MSSSCGNGGGEPSSKKARRAGGDAGDAAMSIFGYVGVGPVDKTVVIVNEFGDDTCVVACVENGVWRKLCVSYEWDERGEGHCAVFDDKRCAHVRKLCLSHINVQIANSLTRLTNLEELTIRPFSICRENTFTPPPGIWPQLRRLTVGYCSIVIHEIVPHQNVLSLVAAAPNVRELRIKWTLGLDCLPDILTGLPMLEVLQLHYMNAYDDADADESDESDTDESDGDNTHAYADLLDCKQLDNVTPPMLLSMHLHKKDGDGNDGPMASMVELAAALVRMQHRSPNRFAIELCGKRF